VGHLEAVNVRWYGAVNRDVLVRGQALRAVVIECQQKNWADECHRDD
jgi:hypothetical protein